MNDDKFDEINKMLINLILRITSLEELLISKNILTENELIEKNLQLGNKLVDIAKKQVGKDMS